ncbi:2Fe-2S iron-sulfur cluster-binding protein [bacterium]|nr:2Fe-2S iron-sulfur cluster-binding protein [bacterium]
MPTITLDNREVTVPEGATILEAARKLGLEIPTLCSLEGCRPETSCLVCVVKVNGGARLLPSCATTAVEGMAVESETPEVHEARRTALELLLSDHLGDCVGPCQSICPARMDIPEMIRLISAGKMAEAVAKVKERIPFPAVLGRICPELCEKGCRRRSLDNPVAIRQLKRYVGDWDILQVARHRPACKPSSGRRVAIVGAGPAGLTAAYYLQQEGHACVLFDEHELPGGMLRYAVPTSQLPRDVLDAEIRSLLVLGAELRAGVQVGRDVPLAQLWDEYHAVLLATGELTHEAAGQMGLPLAGTSIPADKRTQMTRQRGVFVAGSAFSPSHHAVRAVGSGYNAACSISQYLEGELLTGVHRLFTVQMGHLEEAQMREFAALTPQHDRLTPSGGEATGFSVEEAAAEADRCLHCDCAGMECCKLRKWSERYGAGPTRLRDHRRPYRREASHPLVTYEPGKCIACGLCVQIAGRSQERLGLAFIGRGFDVQIGVPFNETLAAGLEQVARECAEACPTAALVLRK